MNSTTSFEARGTSPASFRAGVDLFLISVLILFAELACIRWFPAHVMFLTFFTNVVLLASFVGMSVGCLAASRPRRFLTWTPLLLAVAMAAAHGTNYLCHQFNVGLDVGHQNSPQVVYFGTEYGSRDMARFYIPIEIVVGAFFVLIALAFVGPGQEVGRAFTRLPHRVRAYTVNIFGSLVGIVAFSPCSWAQ